jgi:hypothetical protein
MAHYDIRGNSAGDYETICNKIENVINTNYSEYLTATSYYSEIDEDGITYAGQRVKIEIAKGPRQGEILFRYGGNNTNYGRIIWYYSNNNYLSDTNIYFSSKFSTDSSLVACLDIIEIQNGLIFGWYESGSGDLNTHGYKIYSIIIYDNDDNCIDLMKGGSDKIILDNGNNDIISYTTQYSSTPAYKTTFSDDAIQFTKMFNGHKFLDNAFWVTVGDRPSNVPDVRKFTVNGTDYITLGSMAWNTRNQYAASYVFPLPEAT